MNTNEKWHQGTYTVINKDKYIGKINPSFRSSWELRFMIFCDENVNVIKWSSEEIIIPYYFEYDGKIHNYIVDFYVELKDKNNVIKKYIFEIKPQKELIKPVPPKKRSQKALKNYNYKVISFIRNSNKWRYADAFCRKNNIIFRVLTENNLSI